MTAFQAIISFILSPSFLHSVLRISTPLVAGTLAAYIANKAGLVNVAIEGMMLTAALLGVLLSSQLGQAPLAFLFVIIIGAGIGLLMGLLSEVLEADIFLTGLALNMIAEGGTIFLLFLATGDKGMSTNLKSYTMPKINIPLIENIPVIGKALSGHNVITYLAFILVIVMYIFVNKTKIGLRIRATGENEQAAQTVGIKTRALKLLAITLSGALAAIGGAYLSMGYMSVFSAKMTAGRGFISMSASAMSNGSAFGGTLVALIFGVADTFSSWAQQSSLVNIPYELILASPYIFVIITLVIFNIIRAIKAKQKTMSHLDD